LRIGEKKWPELKEIPIEDIDFTDRQFCFRLDFSEEELKRQTNSIKINGQLNPSHARKKGKKYQIIAGWKRALGVKRLGDRPLKAFIYSNISDEEAYNINLTDNVIREPLTELEIAYQMDHLKNRFGHGVPELMELYGCGKQKVYDRLSLVDMEQEIKNAIHKRNISLSHAVELNMIPVSRRLEILWKTVEESWSVRKLRGKRKYYTQHPFVDRYTPEDIEKMDQWHAEILIKSPTMISTLKEQWTIFHKDMLPAPLKCHFSLTIPAMNSNPRFICPNDIELAILSTGKLGGRVYNIHKFNKPIHERDAWFLWCEECAKLVFPNIIIHHDKIYVPSAAQEICEDDSNDSITFRGVEIS
jgi:ParB family chromosome partitioning protein